MDDTKQLIFSHLLEAGGGLCCRTSCHPINDYFPFPFTHKGHGLFGQQSTQPKDYILLLPTGDVNHSFWFAAIASFSDR